MDVEVTSLSWYNDSQGHKKKNSRTRGQRAHVQDGKMWKDQELEAEEQIRKLSARQVQAQEDKAATQRPKAKAAARRGSQGKNERKTRTCTRQKRKTLIMIYVVIPSKNVSPRLSRNSTIPKSGHSRTATHQAKESDGKRRKTMCQPPTSPQPTTSPSSSTTTTMTTTDTQRLR